MSSSYRISKYKRSYEPKFIKKRSSGSIKCKRYNRFINERHNLMNCITKERQRTPSYRKKYSIGHKSYSGEKNMIPIDITNYDVYPEKCRRGKPCYDCEDHEQSCQIHRKLDYEDDEPIFQNYEELKVDENDYENYQQFPEERPHVGSQNIMNYCLDRNIQYIISRIQSDFKLTEKYKEFVLYEMPYLEVFKPMPSMTMKMNDRFKCWSKQILNDEEPLTDC